MDNGACSYRRYLDGDEAAFDEIMNLLFDNLVFFINRYVHDWFAAEDIAMDTFADLIVHKNRYDFRVSLKTYVFMVGRSRALNYLKRRKHRATASLEDVAVQTADIRADEAFLQAEDKQLLDAALETLPADMRAAVHLVYFEALSYEETARVMRKNTKQIDNLLYRAKKELRVSIGKEDACL